MVPTNSFGTPKSSPAYKPKLNQQKAVIERISLKNPGTSTQRYPT